MSSTSSMSFQPNRQVKSFQNKPIPKFHTTIEISGTTGKTLIDEMGGICNVNTPNNFISNSTKKMFATFKDSPQPTCSPDEAPRFIKDNFCQTGEFIQKTFDSVKENIEKVGSSIKGTAETVFNSINNTGESVIKNVKDNPIPYAVGAGVAALTAGIVIGRISKSNTSETENDTNEVTQLNAEMIESSLMRIKI
jgi:hypothetical protein